MNVYYQVTHKLQAPIIARNVTFHTGFPVGADGRVGGRTYIVQSCDYQNFLNAYITKFLTSWCFAHARAPLLS